MAGHAAETDLAVPDRPARELAPLGVLEAPHVVHRVVEVDVDVVGAKAPQRPLQGGGHRRAGLAAPGLVLRRDDEAAAPAPEGLADRFLRVAAPIALGGVEEGHAALRRVADEAGVGGAARAEGDVGDLEAGAPERHVAPDAGRLGAAARRRTEPRETGGETGGEPGPRPEESPPVHLRLPLRRSGSRPRDRTATAGPTSAPPAPGIGARPCAPGARPFIPIPTGRKARLARGTCAVGLSPGRPLANVLAHVVLGTLVSRPRMGRRGRRRSMRAGHPRLEDAPFPGRRARASSSVG